ncbi:hypothetical protein PO909_013138, partial [Leuciscus waleckii]
MVFPLDSTYSSSSSSMSTSSMSCGSGSNGEEWGSEEVLWEDAYGMKSVGWKRVHQVLEWDVEEPPMDASVLEWDVEEPRMDASVVSQDAFGMNSVGWKTVHQVLECDVGEQLMDASQMKSVGRKRLHLDMKEPPTVWEDAEKMAEITHPQVLELVEDARLVLSLAA